MIPPTPSGKAQEIARDIAERFRSYLHLGHVRADEILQRRITSALDELVSALEAIAQKVPEKVSREEAADMACEFAILARQALARFKTPLPEGGG
jgi:hypothetical protein